MAQFLLCPSQAIIYRKNGPENNLRLYTYSIYIHTYFTCTYSSIKLSCALFAVHNIFEQETRKCAFSSLYSLRIVQTIAQVNSGLVGVFNLSHEIFGPVFWAVWMYLDLNVNRLWFWNLMMLLWFLKIILSFEAFQAKPSRRFLESPRRIGSWGLSCQSFSENWGLSCQSFSENWGLSCQSFLEILRFSEKYLHPKQRFSENR